MADIWQDRFIKRELLPAGELARRFNLGNFRAHPEAQREATESSLDTVGWIDEISLSTNGNGPASLAANPDAVMFDGHERVELALVRGGEAGLVPVNWYQLSPEETDFALLVKDQTTEMAQPIPEKLAALLERTREMTADKPGLGAMLEALRMRASSEWDSINNPPPTLDQLENEYGDGSERDFWPYIKIQVSPETMRRWQFMIDKIPSDDEAQKVEILLGAVDESLLDSELS
jgi:hypothetical protein